MLLKPRKGHEVAITNIFLIFNFKVNLLFSKRLTENDLKKRFDFIKIRIISQGEKGYIKSIYKV